MAGAEEEDDDSGPLVDWLRARGGTVVGARVGPVPGAGRRGVVATRALPQHHVLCAVPAALALTAASSAAAAELERFSLGLDSAGSPRLAREALVLAVLAEEAAGTNSAWHGYLAALPGLASGALRCPELWSRADRALLRGTSVLEDLVEPVDDEVELPCMTREHWENVAAPFVAAFPRLGLRAGKRGFRAYLRAVALVSGYSFSLGEGGAIQAMVPFWDLLNHRSPEEATVRLHYDADADAGKGQLQMITVKAVRAGEEIFNSYGPIGNAELLRRYGFVLAKNPHDCRPLRLRLRTLSRAAKAVVHGAPASPAAARRARKSMRLREGILRRAGIAKSLNVWRVTGRGEVSAKLVETLRVLAMDEADLHAALKGLRLGLPPLPPGGGGGLDAVQHAFVQAVLAGLAERLLKGYAPAAAYAGAAEGSPAALAGAVRASEIECLEALRRSARRRAVLPARKVFLLWRGFLLRGESSSGG